MRDILCRDRLENDFRWIKAKQLARDIGIANRTLDWRRCTIDVNNARHETKLALRKNGLSFDKTRRNRLCDIAAETANPSMDC